MRIDLSKSRLTNHEFLALCAAGKIINYKHRQFHGPEVTDVWLITLGDACRELKLNEISARRAARRGTLEAWKADGVWYTKLINVKVWQEKFPCNAVRAKK